MSLKDELYRSLYGSYPPQPQVPPRFKPAFQPLQQPLAKAVKPKVFVSYHHKDQTYIDAFIKNFTGNYEVFTDCSLDEAIESNDLHYVNRTIREEYITGTSVTIVVCGQDTWRRMCVDWEIYSTLYKDHALLGVGLPHVQPVQQDGQSIRFIPDRLYANIISGYAHWIEWPQNALELSQAIGHAKQRSTNNKRLKDNRATKMTRNV